MVSINIFNRKPANGSSKSGVKMASIYSAYVANGWRGVAALAWRNGAENISLAQQPAMYQRWRQLSHRHRSCG
jgi:hypothetical protein